MTIKKIKVFVRATNFDIYKYEAVIEIHIDIEIRPVQIINFVKTEAEALKIATKLRQIYIEKFKNTEEESCQKK